jgi:2,3-bisphosphoglycerate-independent phosphoglycerate mutase
VHSHTGHLRALLRIGHEQGLPQMVHAFLDGRDTAPDSGAGYVRDLLPDLARCGGRLATLCGRFYAMDRDKRWERVEEAWNLLIHGRGLRESDAVGAVRAAYAAGETDEFLRPRLLLDPAEAGIRAGDGVFFFNFRADRAREMVHAFADESFAFFPRGERPDLAGLATMTAYDETLRLPVAFIRDNLRQTLGETVSGLGLKQLRIAETEKYAHVTYFFNGGREEPFAGEDRILVPSPRDVPTYDLKPAMSAVEVTDRFLAAWTGGGYSFAVCNFANPDMVGHTGVLPAAVRACETVDACVARVEEAVLKSGGRLCLTADHGNVENMLDAHGRPHTAHTTNRTPFLIRQAGRSVRLADGGKLGDIAPTLLELWGVPKPGAMTGNSLVPPANAG